VNPIIVLYSSLQEEIQKVATELGTQIVFEEHPNQTVLGCDVFDVSLEERVFVLSIYLREGVDGNTELATYTRANIETYDPDNLYWILFDLDQVHIDEYVLEALVLTEALLN